MAAGASQFFNHAHRALRIEAVHHNSGRTLKFRMRGEKVRDGIARPGVIVSCRPVMLRLQIVIEKDRIVSSRLQKFFRFVNFANDVKVIAFEAFREPVAAPLVVLKQKDAYRMALAVALSQSKSVS